jgi:hypothetical protein
MMKFNSENKPDVQVVLPDGSLHPLKTYLIPTAILMLSALILMVSMFLPYWRMTMFAPQYPKGLNVDVYVNHLEGDVKEIDALNHYLGMPPLDEGGRFERSISLIAITVLGLLLVASVFVGNHWAGVLAIPVLVYPVVFVADLWLILYRYGHSIDPESALGGAIDPFTPKLIGVGTIGQFKTIASFEIGFYLAVLAGLVVLLGLFFHRAAYKPIVEARKRMDAKVVEAASTRNKEAAKA